MAGSMRSAEYDRFGAPEQVMIRERPIPEAGAGEVLVAVRAAALNPKDVLFRLGKMRLLSGTRFPMLLGYDFAGEVARVGRGVRHVREGDAVFGMRSRAGTLAEYCLAKYEELSRKPQSLDFEGAAALPLTGLTALQALRDAAKLTSGQRVLVNGASGGVGVMALQIARALGARITAVSSSANRELVLALGAEDFRDYASDGVFSGPPRFDAVFDVFGNQSLERVARVLSARGTYVTTVPKVSALVDVARTTFVRPRARLVVVRPRQTDLAELGVLVGANTLRPVIHQIYDLEQVVEAQRQVESKHTRGKVVLRVAA
jgi:NADPH:quinone reductase-like Zn-dependent oxidoreductase